MTVLDAFALIAHFTGEPAADQVGSLLRRRCAVSAVNLAEAIDHLLRRRGLSDAQLAAGFAPLLGESIKVREANEEIAWRAAALRARHYRPRDVELSLADCFLLATASRGEPIATADAALATAARAEGIEIVALPDSRGRRP